MSLEKSEQFWIKFNGTRLLIFFSSFLPLFIYWLSFYPGIFTYDSHYVWFQISTNHITDWHPAYYVIVMWLLSKIWYSPAILSLFQILLFSLALSYAALVISRDLMTPRWFTLVVSFMISLIPINGILSVTIWKDILYSIFVFIFTVMFWQMSKEGKVWLSRNWHLFGFVSANIWLLRHNGLVVVVGSLSVLLILSRKKFTKPLIKSLLFLFLYITIIREPVYSIFRVNKATTQPFSVVFLHPLAAHVANHTELTQTEEKILNQIHPIADWAYSCYDATVFLYKGFNVESLKTNSTFLLKTIIRLSISNPLITLKHLFCQSSFLWNPVHPQGVMFESVYLSSSTDYPKWEKYAKVVSPDSKFLIFMELVKKITVEWLDHDYLKITWRPALYIYFLIINFVIFSIKSKRLMVLIPLIPLFFQIIGIVFTYQYQGIRYIYPVYIVTMFYVPHILYSILTNKIEKT